jgi:hypothetical protein
MQKYDFHTFCLLEKTYEWYKTGNSELRLVAHEIKPFLDMAYSIEIPCHENQVPFWCEACDNSKTRCFVIVMEDDEVLITYNVINLMKSRFVHVMNVPISKNGNKDHIQSVISELRKDEFVRFVFYEPFKRYYLHPERFDNYDNYYIDMDELKDQCIDDSSWRKRSKINTFNNHPDLFEAQIFTNGIPDDLIPDALEARALWRRDKMEHKIENGSTETLGGNSKKDTKQKSFVKCISDKSGRMLTVALLCDHRMFAVETVYLMDGYAIDYFFVHAGRREEADSMKRKIYHNSEDIMKYFLGKALLERGIKRWYVLGSRGEPYLDKHKIRLCNGHKVRFYIDKNL